MDIEQFKRICLNIWKSDPVETRVHLTPAVAVWLGVPPELAKDLCPQDGRIDLPAPDSRDPSDERDFAEPPPPVDAADERTAPRNLIYETEDESLCVYCGWDASDLDHIQPAPWTGEARRKLIRTVPACGECNRTLNDVGLFTEEERRIHLFEVYTKKYRRLLKTATWTDEELDLLGPNLRRRIEARQATKEILDFRMDNLAREGKIMPWSTFQAVLHGR